MIAWGALFLWPLLAMVFFAKMRPAVALTATVVGGYLFLPHGIAYDPPVLPPINKDTVPALMALALTLYHAKNNPAFIGQPGWVPRDGRVITLLVILGVGSVGTVLTNMDTVWAGRTLPGLRIYDVFSQLLTTLTLLLPFLLARKLLATPDTQRQFIWALVIMSLGYSLLAGFEIRMSPQLNTWIYGTTDLAVWIQNIRGGGFRPFVFLYHGLWLAIFFASVIVATLGVVRDRDKGINWKYALAGLWILIILSLSNSVGALVITLLLGAVALFLPTRVQLLAAAIIAVAVLTYPVSRAAHIVPLDRVLDWAESIDPARRQSFQVRVDNEEAMLVRAAERPVFGWGGWGRERVYGEFGENIAVTDGRWMIVLGQGGWFRYIGEFGLMTVGVITLAFRRREGFAPVSVAIALALMANLIDLLPNAGMSPFTWMLAGALAGTLERRGKETTLEPGADGVAESDMPPQTTTRRRPIVYTRQRTTRTRRDDS